MQKSQGQDSPDKRKMGNKDGTKEDDNAGSREKNRHLQRNIFRCASA